MKGWVIILCASIIFTSSIFAVGKQKNTKLRDSSIKAQQKIKKYKIEAGKFGVYKLYKKIISIEDTMNSSEDTTFKHVGYMYQLEYLANKNVKYAKYYYGIHELNFCHLIKTTENRFDKSCTEGISNMRYLAVTEKNSDAMSVLGEVFKDGIATEKSLFVAADWFYKAAIGYYKMNNREKALRAVENSLKAFPNYKKALKLRNKLFN